ncbi:MAG: two-component system, cell cycle sensor histidine kinase and response regulator CckA [Verrucomicrobiota bacterium]|jgi:signal transduction histidine kinase/ActR/RegA family two-component response regulator
MKVQTKITLLLLVVVVIFVVGLWAFRALDQSTFREIRTTRLIEAKRSFETFLAKDGEPLETLAEYDSTWDDMVQAIQTRNMKWLSENVSQETLLGYKANAVWIYTPDATLLYSRDAQSVDPDLEKSVAEERKNTKPSDLPISREAFAKIFAKDPAAHFFIKVGDDLMEIRGATVHGSKDHARQTPQQGFFFVGRLWNEPPLEDMSLFSNTKLSLLSADARPREILEDGLIAFPKTLYGWDGQPLAHLMVRNEMPVVRLLNRSNEQLILSLFIFAFVLLLLIYWSVVRWVSHPLRKIMGSLKRSDPKPIEKLCEDHSEFGELARTTRKFFEQRDNLIREMEERRVTEEALRKSEEELRHSQKMEAVGRLAGGVAHDFNNLLTAIIGYAELISTRTTSNALAKQNADLIRKAGEQAAALTRQLLAFSRKQILQPKVIDLNALVVEMEKLLRRVIGERFDLQSHPDAEMGRVKADPSQLEQVVLNLGVNARDAMPTGGKLIIRTSNAQLDSATAQHIAASLKPGNYVVLSVTDTGAGMDEETKSHIFEPFFTTKGPGKGTGLGLATVYGIVRQTGGGISVESEPGKGSTFRIYLPQVTAPVDFTKTPLAPVDKSENFETVLVVEDEEIVRELVCEVLQEQGYNILCARDGVDALEMAGTFDGTIHLLVTDVIMPNMNGQELAAKLSAVRPDMKVLYVSGYSDNDIGDHGVLDPRFDLLQKPFTPQTLARKIRDVIHERNYAYSTE